MPSRAAALFAETSAELGYHPYPVPSANMSAAYTNPEGIDARRLPILRPLRPIRLCGERQGEPEFDLAPGAA